MYAGRRLRKCLGLLLCSSVLLGIQCSPLVIDSVKTGVVTWVAGSVGNIDLRPVADLFLGSFTGGPNLGT